MKFFNKYAQEDKQYQTSTGKDIKQLSNATSDLTTQEETINKARNAASKLSAQILNKTIKDK